MLFSGTDNHIASLQMAEHMGKTASYSMASRGPPEENEKPFFSYLAYAAPHWPLQELKEVRDLYKGVYDEGPTKLRQRRLERLIELGLVPKDMEPAPMVGLLDPD
ncbi:hypothetical protein DL769_007884 [Monosporascus sp. CRB-8-3]|nr:hypothetical protein DL769_007884 [Monosporascus sp. CRB-8-3]